MNEKRRVYAKRGGRGDPCKFAVITGTRRSSWRREEDISEVILGLPEGTVLLVGDAPGVDLIARTIHRKNHGRCVRFDAAWGELDYVAGPVRNSAMVGAAAELRRCGWQCVGCWAFPDEQSLGTHDCARKLRKAGFDVTEIEVNND